MSSNTSRSPRSTSSSSSSSQSSQSSHSTHSSRGDERTVRTNDQGVTTSIQGDIQQGLILAKEAEVFVQTTEKWDVEAVRKLEERLAQEKSALIDSEKLVNDQTILFKEAQKTRDDKFNAATRLESLVSEKAAERERWLAEERELERKRAATHERAVEMESTRAETLAQAVLAKEEAKVSESLSLQRAEGIKQAQALVDAHRLALQKLEEHRAELKKRDVDVVVRGGALPQPQAVDINVSVKPLDLPEARIASTSVSRGAGATSHIHEALPTHEKTVVAPRQVQASEQHVEYSNIEHHVVTNRDQHIS